MAGSNEAVRVELQIEQQQGRHEERPFTEIIKKFTEDHSAKMKELQEVRDAADGLEESIGSISAEIKSLNARESEFYEQVKKLVETQLEREAPIKEKIHSYSIAAGKTPKGWLEWLGITGVEPTGDVKALVAAVNNIGREFEGHFNKCGTELAKVQKSKQEKEKLLEEKQKELSANYDTQDGIVDAIIEIVSSYVRQAKIYLSNKNQVLGDAMSRLVDGLKKSIDNTEKPGEAALASNSKDVVRESTVSSALSEKSVGVIEEQAETGGASKPDEVLQDPKAQRTQLSQHKQALVEPLRDFVVDLDVDNIPQDAAVVLTPLTDAIASYTKFVVFASPIKRVDNNTRLTPPPFSAAPPIPFNVSKDKARAIKALTIEMLNPDSQKQVEKLLAEKEAAEQALKQKEEEARRHADLAEKRRLQNEKAMVLLKQVSTQRDQLTEALAKKTEEVTFYKSVVHSMRATALPSGASSPVRSARVMSMGGSFAGQDD